MRRHRKRKRGKIDLRARESATSESQLVLPAHKLRADLTECPSLPTVLPASSRSKQPLRNADVGSAQAGPSATISDEDGSGGHDDRRVPAPGHQHSLLFRWGSERSPAELVLTTRKEARRSLGAGWRFALAEATASRLSSSTPAHVQGVSGCCTRSDACFAVRATASTSCRGCGTASRAAASRVEQSSAANQGRWAQWDEMASRSLLASCVSAFN